MLKSNFLDLRKPQDFLKNIDNNLQYKIIATEKEIDWRAVNKQKRNGKNVFSKPDKIELSEIFFDSYFGDVHFWELFIKKKSSKFKFTIDKIDGFYILSFDVRSLLYDNFTLDSKESLLNFLNLVEKLVLNNRKYCQIATSKGTSFELDLFEEGNHHPNEDILRDIPQNDPLVHEFLMFMVKKLRKVGPHSWCTLRHRTFDDRSFPPEF